MSSNGKCYIEIANQANYTFSNVRDNDLVISMTGTEAGLHAGYTSASSNALLSVTKEYFLLGGNNSNFSVSNNVLHVKDINITESLTKNGAPFSLSNVSGDIIPVSNLTYDLGSSNMRFRDLYISGNTIDMEGTKITLDTSNNIQIKDSNNNLRRIIVDEIQIGDDTSAVRIKKDIDGNVQFYKASNSIETLTDVGSGGGISLSNVNQSISSAVPSTGYTQNVINIPTVTVEYVPASAMISYGRVEFGSHSNFSMSNGASFTVNIDHSLNTTEYIVFSTSKNTLEAQVSCFDYTSNSFRMTVKNISGSNIANPVVNYQLIQAQTSNVTRVLAAPPTVIVTSCNLATYSGAVSSNKQVGLSNFTLASDPANYPITYAIASNVTNLFNLSNNVIIYNHQRVSVNSNLFVLLAANPFASNTASPITFNMQETYVNQPLASVNTISTTQNPLSAGEAGVSNLPSTDQGLPVTYTLGTNTLGAILTGNILSWTAAGATQTRSVILNASFAAAIMAEAALAVKEITFSVSENFIPAGQVEWVAKVTGVSDDVANSVCSTSDGGLAISGYFVSNPLTAYNANSLAFGTNLVNSGGYDAFLAKYDGYGNVQWVARLGGAGNEYGKGICGTSDGGVALTGNCASNPLTAYNADTTAFGTTLANLGTDDLFVVKYNTYGSVQWVARFGGGSDESGSESGICSTSDGGIAVIGVSLSNPVTAYNANGTAFGTVLSNAGSYDAVIAKYSSLGAVQWVARLAGSTGDFGVGIYGTSDGGIVVSGVYTSTTLIAYNANTTAFGTTLPNASDNAFLAKYSSSGSVQWITRLGGIGTDEGFGVCSTSDDGIVVTGYYLSATLTAYNADGTAFGSTLANSGSNDIFVAKYNSSGTVLWVSRISGSGADSAPRICNTSDGGVVITGYYASNPLTIYNANGTGYGTTLSNSGSNDVFLAKYSSSGNVQWVSRVAGAGNEIGRGICRMSDGGIAVAGLSGNVLTAYDASGNVFGRQLTIAGTVDAFIVKYSDVGQALTPPVVRNKWVAQIGGTGTETVRGVATSNSGDVYVIGDYNSTTTVYDANGSGFATTLLNSGTDVFIAKYNSSGITQWVTRLTGSGNDIGRVLCVTTDGGVVVTGNYESSPLYAYNSNTTQFETTLANSGSSETFLAKYDSLGNVQWVTRIGGTNGDGSYGICSTTDGGICVAGYYLSSSLVAYNANATAFGTTLSSSGNYDTFVVKYNSSGNVEWIARTAGSGYDVADGVCSTTDGGIVITGYYSSNPLTAYNANTTAFGTTLAQSGSDDVYVVKYNSSGVVQWTARVAGGGGDYSADLCSTPDGGVVVVGNSYNASVTAYNANTTAFGTILSNVLSGDTFIVKYNSSGTVEWATKIGGTSNETGITVCSTSNGTIVATGDYTSPVLTAYNANGTAYQTTLINTGSNDAFMIVLETNGFVKAIAGFTGIGADQGVGIAPHPDGDVVICGYFNNSINPYSSIRTLTSIGGQDGFLAKYGVKGVSNPPASGRCEWLTRLAGTGSEEGRGICSTSDGGFAVVGFYASNPLTAYNGDTTAFGTTLVNSGGNDAFLTKYTSSGTVQWVTRLGGSGGDEGRAICSTSDDGLVVVGYYASNPLTAYNANTTAFGTTLTRTGTIDAFLTKYSLSGTVQWVARLSGASENYGLGVCSTSDGGTVLAGYYISSTLTAYNANATAFATTLANSGSIDVFIAKYNSSGTVQWVARLGGTGADIGQSICSTSSGGIVVTGYYSSSPLTAYNATTVAFGTTLASSGGDDVFVAKYNSSGSVQWVARIAGTGGEDGRVCSTSDDGVVVTAYYYSTTLTAYNANTTAFATTLGNSGTVDVCLVKYNTSGSVQWVARLGGATGDYAQGVCSTSDGGIIVTGWYASNPLTAYNANGTAFGTTLANSGTDDVFLAKYSSEGQVLLVARLSGSGSVIDAGISVCSGPDRSVYVTGHYEAPPLFVLTAYNANGTAFNTTLTGVNSKDVYIAKYIM